MVWKRALLILIKPAKIWKEVAEKPVSALILLAGLILPLSALTSAVNLATDELPSDVLLFSILIYVLTIIGSITGGGYLIWRLSPRFFSQGSYLDVLNLAAFSYIAVFIALIVSSLHHHLDVLKLLGLYSVYIYWQGLTYMLKTPVERKTGFTLISAIILTGCGYLVNIIMEAVIFG